jgi:peptidoglycan/LPS O-acetylase OafA/YrhL
MIAANLVMLQWPLGAELISPVYWTLTFELLFYAFCVVAFSAGFIRSAPAMGAAVVAITTVAVIRTDERILFFAYLLAGTLLRLTVLEPSRGAKIWAAAVLLPVIAAGAAFGLHRETGNPEMAPLAICLANTLSVALFILVIVRRPAVPRSILAFGTMSYSIYLFQDVGLVLLRPMIAVTPSGYVAGVFAVTVAIAAVVWRYVERPFIRLGHSLTGRTAVGAI